MTKQVHITIEVREHDETGYGYLETTARSGWYDIDHRSQLEGMVSTTLRKSGLIDDTFVVELYKHPEPQDLEPSARDFRYGK